MKFRRVVPCRIPIVRPATPALVRSRADGARAATAGRLLSPPGLAAISLALAALICAACVGAQPVSGPAPEDAPHARGKDLYERKCGVCHELFHPVEFECDDWTANVRRYAARANLAPADRPAVIAYLHAYASDAKAP